MKVVEKGVMLVVIMTVKVIGEMDMGMNIRVVMILVGWWWRNGNKW